MLLTSHGRWNSCDDVVVVHAADFKSVIFCRASRSPGPSTRMELRAHGAVATLNMSEADSKNGDGSSSDGDYESLPPHVSMTTHMTAGAVAGILEHTVMYPVDSVKVGGGGTCLPSDVPTKAKLNSPQRAARLTLASSSFPGSIVCFTFT